MKLKVRKLKIKNEGEEILFEKAEPVAKITPKIDVLVNNMIFTMEKVDGIGLAAPQIGVSLRIIIVDHPETHTPIVMINPEILERSATLETGEEGCLSLPGTRVKVVRNKQVIAKFLTPQSVENQIEAVGLLARIIQHEIDHLDGILITDRGK